MDDERHPIDKLIDDLGGATRLARRISNIDPSGRRFSVGTIGAWKYRRSIPVRYWPKLLAVGKHYDLAGISEKALVAAHTQKHAGERRA